jgi:hypothetical protein
MIAERPPTGTASTTRQQAQFSALAGANGASALQPDQGCSRIEVAWFHTFSRRGGRLPCPLEPLGELHFASRSIGCDRREQATARIIDGSIGRARDEIRDRLHHAGRPIPLRLPDAPSRIGDRDVLCAERQVRDRAQRLLQRLGRIGGHVKLLLVAPP